MEAVAGQNRIIELKQSHRTEIKANRRVILTVDDDPSVCRALQRLFLGRFDVVLATSDVNLVETLIAQEGVTHLVCDYYLGAEVPRGTELVARWRQRFPSIAVAVILTGSDISNIKTPPEVDAVLSKSATPSEIAEFVCR